MTTDHRDHDMRERALRLGFHGLLANWDDVKDAAWLPAAYSAAFDQPFRAHPIRIPGIRSGIGAKRRVRGLVRRRVGSRAGVSDLSGGAWMSRAG
jgi:hypothetical protein